MGNCSTIAGHRWALWDWGDHRWNGRWPSHHFWKQRASCGNHPNFYITLNYFFKTIFCSTQTGVLCEYFKKQQVIQLNVRGALALRYFSSDGRKNVWLNKQQMIFTNVLLYKKLSIETLIVKFKPVLLRNHEFDFRKNEKRMFFFGFSLVLKIYLLLERNQTIIFKYLRTW